MEWLVAWWRQIVGPPDVDPWENDPRIRSERRGQHQRINQATRLSGRDQQRRRQDGRSLRHEVEFWERHGDQQQSE